MELPSISVEPLLPSPEPAPVKKETPSTKEEPKSVEPVEPTYIEEEGAVDEAVTRRRRGKDKAGVGGSKVERDTRIKTKKKIIKKIVIDQYY